MNTPEPKTLLSEAELAGASRRSPAFIRCARVAGQIRPAAITGRAYLYDAATVDAVGRIAVPVMTRARVIGLHAPKLSRP